MHKFDTVVPSIAIVLPAFNEEVTLEHTMRAFHASCPDGAIWVVNNCSTDSTESIARSTLVDLGCSGGLINELRKGKGNAIRRAFLDIDADIFVLADADLTYPADRLVDLVRPIVDGYADMVVGDRHTNGHYSSENKRPLHDAGNMLVKKLVNKLFGSNLKDIMSGYRAFSRKFVKSYPILVDGFEVETDMTLHALDKRFRVMEIPVEYVDRPDGSFSKLNTLGDGSKVIFTIVKILRYYRPLLFFSSLAAIVAALSVVCGIPVMEDWIRERFIYHIPLAILASALGIVAALLLTIGLILDAISFQHKSMFELQMLKET